MASITDYAVSFPRFMSKESITICTSVRSSSTASVWTIVFMRRLNDCSLEMFLTVKSRLTAHHLYGVPSQIFGYNSITRSAAKLNRASAMHFFVAKLLSIAVMTYSYVYHLRNLRPANLLRTQRINFSMRPQHVCMTRDPTIVWCFLSREPPWIPT